MTTDIDAAETECKNIANYFVKTAGDINSMDARYFKYDNMPNDTF